MKLKEVSRKAVVAWSPSTQHPDLIALGTVAGALDASFSSSAELEIFPLGLAKKDQSLRRLGSAPSPHHFQKLSWGLLESPEHPLGLIAGGMENGNIFMWNPDAIVNGRPDQAIITSMERHTGTVRGLEFNPNQTNVLASAAADGEVFIWDIVNVMSPSVYTPFNKQRSTSDELTCITWNRSKSAPHIFACAGQSGKTLVWDLRQRRSIRELCNPAAPTARVSCLAWNFEDPFQLVVASDDDRTPALQLWDLRQPISPLLAMNGHSRGVLAVSWCPHDAGLLLSSGKDNRTLCWDPTQGEMLCELPASTNWNFDVQWSPRAPAVLCTASFDGKVSVHSLLDVGAAAGRNTHATLRAPSWLRRPAGVCFGFGGALLSIQQPSAAQAKQMVAQEQPIPRRIVMNRVTPDAKLTERAASLRDALQGTRSLAELCTEKAQAVREAEPADAEAWTVMGHLLESEPRLALLRFLGFDPEQTRAEVDRLLSEKAAETEAAPAPPKEDSPASAPKETEPARKSPTDEAAAADAADATLGTDSDAAAADETRPPATPVQEIPDAGADLFGGMGGGMEDDPFAMALAAPPASLPGIGSHPAGGDSDAGGVSIDSEAPVVIGEDKPGCDAAVSRALYAGNFSLAVDVCLQCGRLADALLIAVSGGAELVERTQRAVMRARASHKYMRLVAGVTDRRLMRLFQETNPVEWREMLALACSYANETEFRDLCNLLGQRLEGVLGDTRAALVCYMCAGNTDKVVIEMVRRIAQRDGDPTDALCNVVEFITIYRLAMQDNSVHELMTEQFALYAAALAGQGLLADAGFLLDRTFALRSNPQAPLPVRVLADRIYYAMGSEVTESAPPVAFDVSDIGFAPEPMARPVSAAAQAKVPHDDTLLHAFGAAYTAQTPSFPAGPAAAPHHTSPPAPAAAARIPAHHTMSTPKVTGPAAAYRPPSYGAAGIAAAAAGFPVPGSGSSGDHTRSLPGAPTVGTAAASVSAAPAAAASGGYSRPGMPPGGFPTYTPAVVPQAAPVQPPPSAAPAHTPAATAGARPTGMPSFPRYQPVAGVAPTQPTVTTGGGYGSSGGSVHTPSPTAPPTLPAGSVPGGLAAAAGASGLARNMTFRPSEPMGSAVPAPAPSTSAASAAAAPIPKMEALQVDFSSAPADVQPVLHTLRDVLVNAQTHQTDPQTAKKVQFISKQLGEMFVRLTMGGCPPAAKERLLALCRALQQGQRPTATELQQELSRENWPDHGAGWMSTAVSGLHLLIKL